jgi:DNA primase
VQHSNDRDRVLDASDIADVVGEHCALKAKGREYVCLCPFHDDRNPSMYVVPQKQMFHCFVCGAGGNAIDFVMRYHGMGFREALQLLAEKAGIELTPLRRQDAAGRAAQPNVQADGEWTRDELAKANSFALDFFRSVLRHAEHGAAAREAITTRGIADEMVERFELGAAPDRFDGLLKTIEARRLDPRLFEAAGLVKRRERDGGYYDALRNRLIFPILDQAGRPIAFGGRILNPDDTPKYLNSPETALFLKGSTLYGLKQAWPGIRHKKTVVVTEGYTDVIACHQHGFDNVVATLGTALTPKHANLLKRVVDRVVLLFDGDEAGQRAADRALEAFFREPVDVQIAVLPGGRDPDDILTADGGSELFRQTIDGAADALEYRFGRFAERLETAGLGRGSAARAGLIEQDLRRLVDLGLYELSPIVQSTVARRYAAIAGVDEAAVRDTLTSARRRVKRSPARNRAAGDDESARTDSTGASPADGRTAEPPRLPKTAADHALACVLAQPALAEAVNNWRATQTAQHASAGFGEPTDFLSDLRALTQNGAYSSAHARDLARLIGTWTNEGAHLGLPQGAAAVQRVINESRDEIEQGVARSFAMAVERQCDADPHRVAEHWHACIMEVKRAAGLAPTPVATPSQHGDHETTTPDPTDDLARRLEARRQAHGAYGGNPRAMPKPRIG